MKKLTEYREITPQEGLRILADHWPNPVPNMAYRKYKSDEWEWHPDFRDSQFLVSIDKHVEVGNSITRFWFSRHGEIYPYSYQYCAQVTERYPRDAPEGVPPLPDDKPWLAYVPKWRVLSEGEYYAARPKHKDYIAGYTVKDDAFHYAIDCRTDFARVNYPDIVEAMELDE